MTVQQNVRSSSTTRSKTLSKTAGACAGEKNEKGGSRWSIHARKVPRLLVFYGDSGSAVTCLALLGRRGKKDWHNKQGPGIRG